jgi:hypothetical protein
MVGWQISVLKEFIERDLERRKKKNHIIAKFEEKSFFK